MKSHQHRSLLRLHKPTERDGAELLRLAFITLCLLLTAAVVANYLHWRNHRDRLLAILAAAQVNAFNKTASQRIQYETTIHHAQTLVARALVHQVMNFEPGSESLPDLSPQEKVRALETAEDLARSALLAQPNNWQAAMLLGASRYLSWSISKDRRLFSKASAWEEPLRRAVATTPGKPQARRLLAAAYLETWWALSPEKKAFAKDLLSTAFRYDEQAFVHLAPLWLKTAGSQEEAFTLVPDTPFAWQVLSAHYRRAEDWPAVARVHRRHLLALEIDLQGRLEEAARRLQLGDLEGGRSLCLEVLVAAPPQARFAPLAARALALYPPGLHQLRSTAALAEWLHFALRLDLEDREILPPSAINTLSDLLEDLEAPEYFHAALLGNDTRRLREAQRRVQQNRSWAPFLLAQARRQLADGDLPAAARSLDLLDPISKRLLLSTHLRHRLASSDSDPTKLAAATQALAPLYRHHWSVLDWRGDAHHSYLFFLPAVESTGLRIEIVQVPEKGGVVEFLLDGTLIDVQAVRSTRTNVLHVPVSRGIHLLELRSLYQEEVSAGQVKIL